MFDGVKTKLKEKYRKGQIEKREKEPDCFKDYFKNELSNLEKLVAEEAKLQQMAKDKRQEINKVIEGLERKMSLLNEEVGKMQLRFEGLFKDKEMGEERVESELFTGRTESNHVVEGGENEISRQQGAWELRLQRKEEENDLLTFD